MYWVVDDDFNMILTEAAGGLLDYAFDLNGIEGDNWKKQLKNMPYHW